MTTTPEAQIDPLEAERKVAIDILSNWGARYVHPRYQDDINCAVHHAANAIAAYVDKRAAKAAEARVAALEAALNTACRRGCNHCADDIREARKACP